MQKGVVSTDTLFERGYTLCVPPLRGVWRARGAGGVNDRIAGGRPHRWDAKAQPLKSRSNSSIWRSRSFVGSSARWCFR